MLDTSCSGGTSHLARRTIQAAWPWITFAVVGIFLAQIVASPSYAWWFTPTEQTRAVTPVHQQGLVVSPIASSLLPQFLLQPLSQTVAETAPSITSTPQPTPSPTAIPQPKPVVTAKKIAVATIAQPVNGSMAEIILGMVNQQRQANGLPALRLNSSLTASAQAYSQRMAGEHFFSHVAPDGQNFKQRNELAGYTNWTWMGENIAYGQASAAMVMSDWMNSPDHRANILNEHAKELGVGVSESNTKYWVQEFGSQ